MPKPSKKELSGGKDGKQKFISRCIKHMKEKEGRKQDQASAICYSYWREAKKKKK